MIAISYQAPGDAWLTRPCDTTAEADAVAAKLLSFGCRVELPTACCGCGSYVEDGERTYPVNDEGEYQGRCIHTSPVLFAKLILEPAIREPAAFNLAATVARYRRLCRAFERRAA